MYGGDGMRTFALPIIKPMISVSGQTFMTCIALQGIFPSRP
jgi:microcystin-dependent protein